MDLTAIEKQAEGDIPQQVSKVLDSVSNVYKYELELLLFPLTSENQKIAQEVESRLQKYTTVYNNCIKLVSSLERFGIEVKNKSLELDSLEVCADCGDESDAC